MGNHGLGLYFGTHILLFVDDFDVVDHPPPSGADPVTVTPSDEPLKNKPTPSNEPLKNCPTPSSDETRQIVSDSAECVDSFKAAPASQVTDQSTSMDNNDKLDCDATLESQADRVDDLSARVTHVTDDRLSSSPSPELVPSPVEKRSPKLQSNKQSLAESGQNSSSVKGQCLLSRVRIYPSSL